jgi:hypothetical protein
MKNEYEDYKTAHDRLERSGQNDWKIIPVLVVVGVVFAMTIAIELYGPDRFIELVASFF